MINLIPPGARKMVVKEYWLRVCSVWLFLFGTGCLLVASLMLPTYVLLQNELRTLRDLVAQNEAEVVAFDTNAAALNTAMKQTNILLSTPNNNSYVTYTKELNRLAGEEVAISSLAFERKGTSTAIIIVGVAATRSALANFRDNLEAHESFSDPILPIASLIKDKKLDFSLTVTGVTI